MDAGSPEVLTYLHTDHLATPRYGTNAAGATVWTWDSGAFGKEAATGSATVNLRFPGQYFDAETGLHYNWNRYYNPQIGRYISSDPIGLAGGLNPFNYVDVNPLKFIDPYGFKYKPYDIWTDPPQIDTPNTATKAYNCHGNTFCNSQTWLNDEQLVEDILDDCYVELGDDEPNKIGDIAIWRDVPVDKRLDPDGKQSHSGTVTGVDGEGNTTRVRSKGGQAGITYHHPDDPNAGLPGLPLNRVKPKFYRRIPGPCQHACPP